MAFSIKIDPILLKKSAYELGVSPYSIRKIISSDTYKNNKRKTLFISLSDGSRIDQFRRSAGINNEQISGTYSISIDKATEFLKELNDDCPKSTFNTIILIDDFTASGRSCIRYEETKWNGKIIKFLKDIYEKKYLIELFDPQKLDIHILYYIATQYSLDYIDSEIKKYRNEIKELFSFSVQAIQVIDDYIKDQILNDMDVVNFIKNNFDGSIIDEHYRKGKHNEPYLGFDECSIPLVLHHNTPNNSFPILWFPEDKKIKGLFPRISRHKE